MWVQSPPLRLLENQPENNMAKIETKYNIGDVVYLSRPEIKKGRLSCPDCLDTREWKATSPAGTEYTFRCPRCSTSYRSDHRLNLDYNYYAASAQELTIGSVRVDTEDIPPVTYMCRETGVGSGWIYKECELHNTKAEAMADSEVQAAAKNNDPLGQILPYYNEHLELSDYQLKQVTELPKIKRKRKPKVHAG
jgi:hypothetical protein